MGCFGVQLLAGWEFNKQNDGATLLPHPAIHVSLFVTCDIVLGWLVVVIPAGRDARAKIRWLRTGNPEGVAEICGQEEICANERRRYVVAASVGVKHLSDPRGRNDHGAVETGDGSWCLAVR